jgi:excisionase family DNA binding protein
MLSDPAHVPRLLEVHEVAYQLKCSQEHVFRLIRKGKLAAIRIGTRSYRIDPADVHAFLEAQRVTNGNGASAPHEGRRGNGGAEA